MGETRIGGLEQHKLHVISKGFLEESLVQNPDPAEAPFRVMQQAGSVVLKDQLLEHVCNRNRHCVLPVDRDMHFFEQ